MRSMTDEGYGWSSYISGPRRVASTPHPTRPAPPKWFACKPRIPQGEKEGRPMASCRVDHSP